MPKIIILGNSLELENNDLQFIYVSEIKEHLHNIKGAIINLDSDKTFYSNVVKFYTQIRKVYKKIPIAVYTTITTNKISVDKDIHGEMKCFYDKDDIVPYLIEFM